jgi:hypothetical protein
MDPSNYDFYTSDKELGEERGHIGSLDLAYLFSDRRAAGPKTQLDGRVMVLYYQYPGFPLISSRASVFAELGLRFDF